MSSAPAAAAGALAVAEKDAGRPPHATYEDAQKVIERNGIPKSQACKHYHSDGGCEKGEMCTYIHVNIAGPDKHVMVKTSYRRRPRPMAPRRGNPRGGKTRVVGKPSTIIKCPKCHGAGEVDVDYESDIAPPDECDRCNGTGHIVSSR